MERHGRTDQPAGFPCKRYDKELITMENNQMLDPYSEEYKKATLQDLVGDALARKDKDALEWLQTESAKKDQRIHKHQDQVKKIAVSHSIARIRADYARKFLHYKPNRDESAERARKRKQEKAERDRLQLFADAFAKLEE